MPVHEHRLHPDRHAAFLAEGRADPFSRVRFQPGAVVVGCAGCGTVFLRESWDALGGRHCGQPDTLATLGAAPRPAAPPVAAAGPPAAAAPVAPGAASPPVAGRKRSVWPWVAVGGVALAAVLAAGLLLGRGEPAEDVDDPDGPAPVQEAGLTLRMGELDGRLEPGDDTTSNGYLRDTYTFETRGRGPFAFAVEARFEPLLVVTTPDGTRLEAPQATDRSRAFLVVPTGRGRYTVAVGARARGVEGAYTLSVRPQRRTTAIRPDVPVTDSLGGPDAYTSEDRYEAAYTLALEEGAGVTLTLATSGFAPRVQVTGPGGAVRVEEGRDGDARTYTFEAPGSGTHTIVVSTVEPGQQGAFRLTAAVEPPDPEPPLLALGEPARGTLEAGETDRFRFEGLSGQRLVLAVAAERFSPRLRLLGADGTVVATGADALATTLRADGTFTVELTASTDSTGGPYAVTARVMAPDDEGERPIQSEIRREPPGRELPTESGERPVGSATYNVSGTARRTEAALLPPNPGVDATGVYRLVVAADGAVTQAEIVQRSGNPVLDADALRALRRWRFEPEPGATPTPVTVTIRFTTR